MQWNCQFYHHPALFLYHYKSFTVPSGRPFWLLGRGWGCACAPRAPPAYGPALMYNRNSNGPNVLPWEIPHMTYCMEDSVSPMSLIYSSYYYERKSFIYFPALPLVESCSVCCLSVIFYMLLNEFIQDFKHSKSLDNEQRWALPARSNVQIFSTLRHGCSATCRVQKDPKQRRVITTTFS